MKDRYDIAVDYLCAHPSEIDRAWKDLEYHSSSCLFEFVRADRSVYSGFDGKACGCLTMIRNNPELYSAQTKELTRRIVADARIPLSVSDWDFNKLDPRPQLEVFAGWQREIDRVLGRNGVTKESEP